VRFQSPAGSPTRGQAFGVGTLRMNNSRPLNGSFHQARNLDYTAEKKILVIKICTERGWWRPDPLLPHDTDERYYIVPTEFSFEKDTQ
jgi:hypothetical protein